MSRQPFMKYLNFGWQLMIGASVLTFGGYWLDRRFDMKIWTVVGLLFGIAYCGVLIWQLIRETDKR